VRVGCEEGKVWRGERVRWGLERVRLRIFEAVLDIKL